MKLRGRATDLHPGKAFDRLSDFEAYKRHSNVIHSVEIGEEDGFATSEWEVEFQSGTLIWRERDIPDPQTRTIRFTLLDGDPAAFEGSWRVEDEGGTCVVVEFEAVFDLGVPSFEDVLDPLARETMVENVQRILTGLFPGMEVEEVSAR